MLLPNAFNPAATTVITANNGRIIYATPAAGNRFSISTQGHTQRTCDADIAVGVVADLAGGQDVLDWRERRTGADVGSRRHRTLADYAQSGADIVNGLLDR